MIGLMIAHLAVRQYWDDLRRESKEEFLKASDQRISRSKKPSLGWISVKPNRTAALMAAQQVIILLNHPPGNSDFEEFAVIYAG